MQNGKQKDSQRQDGKHASVRGGAASQRRGDTSQGDTEMQRQRQIGSARQLCVAQLHRTAQSRR